MTGHTNHQNESSGIASVEQEASSQRSHATFSTFGQQASNSDKDTLTPDEVTAEQLKNRKYGRCRVTSDREFRCPLCQARCTESVDGSVEFGHATGCPERPAHLPKGGKQYKPLPEAVATDGGERS